MRVNHFKKRAQRRAILMGAGATSLALLLAGAAQAQDAQPTVYSSAMRYDGAGRLVGTIAPDPDGDGPLRHGATRTSYNAMGQKVKIETGELSAWQPTSVAPNAWPGFTILATQDFAYDVMGRLVRTRSLGSDGQVAAVTDSNHDRVGQPACTAVRMNPAAFASLPANACFLGAEGAQGPDRIVRNYHDAAGQATKVQKAYGTALVQDYASYTYSPNGKQISVTDANSNRAELRYDGHDRQTHWIFPSKAATGQVDLADYEQYGYDENGNRISLRKRDGTTLGYQYDSLNRMTLKTVPASASGAAGYNVFYGYDLRGLATFARFGSSTGPGVSNAYDGFGRLLATTTNMDGTARTISSQYDAGGNRVQLTANTGYFLTFAYDLADRMKAVAENGGGVVLQFGYDRAGQRSSLGSGPGATSSAGYGYDSAGRLNALTHDLAGTSDDQGLGFGYNSADQIATRTSSNPAYASNTAYNVSRPYSVNGLNQYTAAGPATFQYDANGNLISHVSPDGSRAYVYDAENRLVSASGPSATLSYDPLGRLWQVSSQSAGTTRFEYDGDRLLQEYNGAGTPVRLFAHGPGADEPLIVYETGLPRRFLHADHQGSIIALADPSGNKVAVNAYDSWGIPNVAPQGRFGYTGQAWLPELGMYYYKARIYSPTLGRFLQTDPIGYEDQVNLYAYVGNDPVNNTDPSGKCGVNAFRYYCRITYGNPTRAASRQSRNYSTLQDHFAHGRGRAVFFDPQAWGIGRDDQHGITVQRAANNRLGNPNSQVLTGLRRSAADGGKPVPIRFSTIGTTMNSIGNYTINWEGTITASAGRYRIDAVGQVAPQPYDWEAGGSGTGVLRDVGVWGRNTLGIGNEGTSFTLLPNRPISATFQGPYRR